MTESVAKGGIGGTVLHKPLAAQKWSVEEQGFLARSFNEPARNLLQEYTETAESREALTLTLEKAFLSPFQEAIDRGKKFLDGENYFTTPKSIFFDLYSLQRDLENSIANYDLLLPHMRRDSVARRQLQTYRNDLLPRLADLTAEAKKRSGLDDKGLLELHIRVREMESEPKLRGPERLGRISKADWQRLPD